MKGCGFGLGLSVVVLGLFVTVFYFGDVHGTQMLLADDERAFRPIDNLPYARTLAGPGLHFAGFEAKFVKSDGTVDLAADYGGEVSYDFAGTPEAVSNRPVGAGGGTQKVRHVFVRATQLGWKQTGTGPRGEKYYDLNLGMRRREIERDFYPFLAPSEPPTCSLAALWKSAMEKGAPHNAVAVIDYKQGVYDFEIEGTEFRFKFDAKCRSI